MFPVPGPHLSHLTLKKINDSFKIHRLVEAKFRAKNAGIVSGTGSHSVGKYTLEKIKIVQQKKEFIKLTKFSVKGQKVYEF